jgi:hypothetical protein
VDRWLSDGRAQGWSSRTLTDHRQNLARFAWWLEHKEEVDPTLAAWDPSRVRSFLAYLREPHPVGRFGSGNPGAKRGARPASVATYYRDLRAFTNFCRAEGLLEADPLKNVKPPRVPYDQLVPLEKEQIQILLDPAHVGERLVGGRMPWPTGDWLKVGQCPSRGPARSGSTTVLRKAFLALLGSVITRSGFVSVPPSVWSWLSGLVWTRPAVKAQAEAFWVQPEEWQRGQVAPLVSRCSHQRGVGRAISLYGCRRTVRSSWCI